MSMSLIAGLIAAVVVLSVIVSAISYSRQKSIAERQKRLKLFKQEAQDLITLQQTLLRFDEHYDILQLFQKQISKLLLQAQDLAPGDRELAAQLAQEGVLLKQFQASQRNNSVDLVCRSDKELAQNKLALAKVSKGLDILANKGVCNRSLANEYKQHIKRLQLDLEVSSHEAQAQDYAERNDVVMYQNHLKQARDALSKSNLNFDGKNERIRQLSDIIAEAKKHNKIVPLDQNADEAAQQAQEREQADAS